MAWFKRSKENISSDGQKKDIPDGMWTKCDGCGEIIHKKQLEQNYFTCAKCSYHFRIGSKEYFEILLDHGNIQRDRKKNAVAGSPQIRRYEAVYEAHRRVDKENRFE